MCNRRTVSASMRLLKPWHFLLHLSPNQKFPFSYCLADRVCHRNACYVRLRVKITNEVAIVVGEQPLMFGLSQQLRQPNVLFLCASETDAALRAFIGHPPHPYRMAYATPG
jgi:hypothetical protein